MRQKRLAKLNASNQNASNSSPNTNIPPVQPIVKTTISTQPTQSTPIIENNQKPNSLPLKSHVTQNFVQQSEEQWENLNLEYVFQSTLDVSLLQEKKIFFKKKNLK